MANNYYKITNQPGSYKFFEDNKSRIEGIARANNVDTSVARDMFISNITQGTNYPGGGVANIGELNRAYQKSLVTNNQARTSSPSSYQDQIARLLEQQRQEEQRAIQQRTQATVDSIGAYRPQVQQSYEDAARQAYINQVRSQGSLGDVLASQGYSGGMTETAMLGLNSEYNQALGQAQQTKSQAEIEIERMIAEAKATGNTDLANSMANYYQNYIAQLQNQQQQQNYLGELQMAGQQTSYDNAYKLFAQGVRTPAVLKALGIEDYQTAQPGQTPSKPPTPPTPKGITYSDEDIAKLSPANQRHVGTLLQRFKAGLITNEDFIAQMQGFGVRAGFQY